MRRSGAIRLLTYDELKFFNDTYSFELVDNFIFVKVKNFNRTTSHPIDKSFSLRMTSSRRLTISVEAIHMWIEKFKDSKYSIVDIQNAMNALIISYQQLRYEDVMSQLKIIKKGEK